MINAIGYDEKSNYELNFRTSCMQNCEPVTHLNQAAQKKIFKPEQNFNDAWNSNHRALIIAIVSLEVLWAALRGVDQSASVNYIAKAGTARLHDKRAIMKMRGMGLKKPG